MKRALARLVALTALCLLDPASAQQSSSALQAYEVELIVFRHLAASNTEEQWNLEAASGEQLEIPEEDASPFETSQPAPSVLPSDRFAALPASKHKLTAMYESLRRSRNYQPVAHFGWTQPGFARDAAPFLPVSAFVPAASGVSGQIALSRGRYLHLTLDLTYIKPPSDSEPTERYVLRQSRRMRSNERHYIDHPKFGVIALVTPSEG
jgi:hypothetical protein